ncbi:MAG TPA: thioredoxin domain-containing protein [Myxococcota bacterium]|nr:thioredoxin domain-containing protein [Myxococcota bacterium]
MSKLNPQVGPGDHQLGNPSAKVTLVEYGDFECPHCGRAHGIVKPLVEKLGDGILFVFRNFPLAQIHPHAYRAALAAEAAGAQGRFFPMHDVLFEHQGALEATDLLHYAKELELDLERFRRDLRGETFADKIRDDFRSGVRSGVNGTPTFFLNGARYDGAWDGPNLLKAIREIA